MYYQNFKELYLYFDIANIIQIFEIKKFFVKKIQKLWELMDSNH